MATNLDGDEVCRHWFTGLPEDCVRCAREAHQRAIEAAYTRALADVEREIAKHQYIRDPQDAAKVTMVAVRQVLARLRGGSRG